MNPDELKRTDISETNPSNAEGANASELDKFFDNDSIKANQEMIEGVLNKAENKSLKEGFENFLSKEKNVVKKNAIKLKLSKATDELTVKSIIAEVVEGGYKIGDKENVGENVGNGEKMGDEKSEENQNGSLEDSLQQAEEDIQQAEEKKEQADKNENEAIKNENEAIKNENEAIKNENEAIKNENEADKNENEAIKNENEAIKNKEQVDKQKLREEALKARKDLLNSHPNQDKAKELDESTRKEAEKIKNELPEETKKQLKEKGYDENFINDYILLRVTTNEVKKDSSFDKNAVAQFESKVNELSKLDVFLKNIDNACNIPDTGLSSFDSKNISQTRNELFNKDIGNDSLISAKKSNIESHDYSKVFPEMGEDEMFIKYGQFLEGNLKNYWDQYKDNYLGFMDKLYSIREQQSQGKTLTDEEKEILSLPGKIKGIKENMDNDTKDMMEELCIISQIKGMFMCMGEGDDFDLNKANEIESENGVLTLRGHIDGVDFAIRQDTNNPEARLQTSTKLAKERKNKDDTNKSENFIVGGKDNFVDSNFILPSQEEIFESIKGTINDTIKSDELFKISDNSEEYLKNLQTNIMGKLEEKYEKTKYAQHYMKEQVKGEKIIDKTISFIEKIKDSELDAEVNNSKTQLYDFLNLVDFNVRYSTSAEKDKFYKVMDRVDRMLEQAKDNPTDGELRDHNDKFGQYLTGNIFLNTRNVLNNKVGGESAKYAFDLFKNYKIEGDQRKNGELFMINFDKMLNDLNEVEQDKKDAESLANIESNLYGAYGDLTLSYA